MRVTETELAILEVLWERGPSLVRAISERLYDENNPTSHATVKSLLDRLEEKGCVRRDGSGFAHVFSATLQRSEFIGQQLQNLADCHFQGSLTPLVMNLMERFALSDRDRKAIRRIIDRAK